MSTALLSMAGDTIRQRIPDLRRCQIDGVVPKTATLLAGVVNGANAVDGTPTRSIANLVEVTGKRYWIVGVMTYNWTAAEPTTLEIVGTGGTAVFCAIATPSLTHVMFVPPFPIEVAAGQAILARGGLATTGDQRPTVFAYLEA